ISTNNRSKQKRHRRNSIPPEIESTIRRAATLKSSLFSARIEGNPLTLDDLPQRASNDQKKREIFNIMKATEFMHQRCTSDITISTLLQMHQKIMNGLIDKRNTGYLRNKISAICNSAGIAIYLPPPPSLVQQLLN